MATVTNTLREFPGFGVCYDPAQKPYFQVNVVETLKTIDSKPLGAQLLQAIAAAAPLNKTVALSLNAEARALIFARGINVMCIPTTMEFYESGFKKVGYTDASNRFVKTGLQATPLKQFNPDGCRFYGSGGSYAEAADPSFAGNLKGGTVSIMHYTNAQTFSQGSGVRETTYPHIVVAHELIHSLHHLLGTRNEAGEEEQWTTGIGKYKDEPMSENKIRQAFGLPLRQSY